MNAMCVVGGAKWRTTERRREGESGSERGGRRQGDEGPEGLGRGGSTTTTPVGGKCSPARSREREEDGIAAIIGKGASSSKEDERGARTIPVFFGAGSGRRERFVEDQRERGKKKTKREKRKREQMMLLIYPSFLQASKQTIKTDVTV